MPDPAAARARSGRVDTPRRSEPSCTVLRRSLLAALAASSAGPALAAVPPDVARQLPPDHGVLGSASMRFGTPARIVVVVALGRDGEGDWRGGDAPSPPRPLLIFARGRDGGVAPIGRNDTVVHRADEGGQCDPFLDGGGVIAVRGAFFTVQNGVACGRHWTDYVTFRFDDARGGFVFDNERVEAWTLNPSNAPDAEALVRAGPQRIRRGDPRRPIRFDDWRPRR